MNCQGIKKRERHIRRPRHVTNPFRQKRKNVIGISRIIFTIMRDIAY